MCRLWKVARGHFVPRGVPSKQIYLVYFAITAKGCKSPGIVGTAETGNLGIRFLTAARAANLNLKFGSF